MKRAKELEWLARQHHAALVLARHVQRLDPDDHGAVAPLIVRVLHHFDQELDAHFRFEEERLLPLLAEAGAGTQVQRTLADHAELRGLAARLRAGDVSSLRHYGELLNAHIRFEDRELFVLAETILPPAILATLAAPEG